MALADNLGRILATRLVHEDEYYTVEVDYITNLGIARTLRLPHFDAASLVSSLTETLATIPEDERKASFQASVRRER